MADVFINEAVNIFCGIDDPTRSNHLTLSEIKLPGLEENMVDHIPGGAPIAVEIDTHIAKLEATFNLAGWTPNVMTMIGQSAIAQQVFTVYGVIRDRRTGLALEAKSVINGRLAKVNPTNWKRGELQHHEYAIRSIMHYELYMDSAEIYWWDFFLNARRIGGVDVNQVTNSILRIPVGAPTGP